jgi:NADPH2 dehydrogenase
MASESRLFHPLPLTPTITLTHRITMAPLTRFRATDAHVPANPLMATYYAQRAASLPGTLLVSEAAHISPAAGGFPHAPGVYNAAQAAAWREITDAVHARGGFIFCQLWAMGRAAKQALLDSDSELGGKGVRVHSASAVPIPAEEGNGEGDLPVEMTVEEIGERVREYADAARRAVGEGGFDGVEIHAANGYLVDQFLQDTCNRRTDGYGGSVENRSRFAVEVVKAVVEAVGAEKTAVRLSPWSRWQGMGMKDPVPQFEDVIGKINGLGLAYLHLVKTRIAGNKDVAGASDEEESLDFAVRLWDGPLMINGGLKPQGAKDMVDKEYKDRDVMAAFGRHYISNPDLPYRIKEGIELSHYDRATFYTPKTPVGYADQPFSKEFEALHGPQLLI